MDISPEGIAGVFDRAADTYDAVGVDWFGPIAAGLVAKLDVEPGERALDIGCGRGAALLPLTAAVGPTGRVLGIDLAPGMVSRTAAETQHLPHVEVRVGDALDPDLPQGSFDVVASSLVLFFLPDPLESLRAWVRLLAPDGRLGTATFGRQDPWWQELDAVFTPYLPPSLRDARTTGARGPFASDENLEQLFVQAGLVGVRTVRRDVQARFTSPTQYLNFSWSHGQRAMWESVPPEKHDVVTERLTDLLTRRAEERGELCLDQQIRYTVGRRQAG